MSTSYPRAKIQFEHYHVKSIDFTLSDLELDEGHQVELDYRLKHRIAVSEDRTHARVDLACELFPQEGPFRLQIEIQGFFTVTEEAGDESELQTLLSTNTLAILYPYLRASITSITAVANLPPVILPTVNIAAMVAKKAKKQATNRPKGQTD